MRLATLEEAAYEKTMEGKEGCDICCSESIQYGWMETTPYNKRNNYKSQMTLIWL